MRENSAHPACFSDEDNSSDQEDNVIRLVSVKVVPGGSVSCKDGQHDPPCHHSIPQPQDRYKTILVNSDCCGVLLGFTFNLFKFKLKF